jgi:hypothetical protein
MSAAPTSPASPQRDRASYSVGNPAWAQFDKRISQQLAQLEERGRKHWTPRAVRQSLGR